MTTSLLPLNRIRYELFDSVIGASRVRAAYNLPPELRGSQLEAAMWEVLGQAPKPAGATLPTNREIFQAAVLALASNMRSWSNVVEDFPRLAAACCGYDPAQVAANVDQVLLDLTPVLGGQTGRGDRTAITRWAALLNEESSFGGYLNALADACSESLHSAITVSAPVVTAVVAGTIAFTVRLKHHPAKDFGFPAKAPGMGGPLASEFLRNLGWSGFKPDRHIIRLLDGWAKEDARWHAIVQQSTEDSERILAALNVRNAAFKRFLYYSRLGELATPADTAVTRADQLVWLYGSQIQKKPRKKLPASLLQVAEQ